MEVVYEGEGGSPCAPYITDIAESAKHKTPRTEKRTSPYMEKSHYIKFREMAHGRKIIPISKVEPQWPYDTCMPFSSVCGNQNKTGTYFCYLGESISVTETSSGVWPIAKKKKLPTNLFAYSANTRFNRVYTSLLHCLEISMNGNPRKMSTCMGKMYEMQSAGKVAVTTPLYKGGDPNEGPNLTPMWMYLRDWFKGEGIPTFTTSGHSRPQFC
uniref:Uncharacterized protein n=1 Tax=Ciona savignyi TaxID=51511 RepID=H2Z1G7_CIOSA